MGGIELRSASGSETRTHTSGTALRPLTYTSTATYGPYKTTQHRGHWVTQGNSADIGTGKLWIGWHMGFWLPTFVAGVRK